MSKTQLRAGAVIAAVIANVVVWLIAAAVIDGDLRAKAGSGSAQTVNIGFVVVATAVAGLVGWGVLVLLERSASRPRTVWTAIAVVVFLLSLAGPLGGGQGGGTKLALALMHVVAAVVIIPTFARSVTERARASA